MKIFNLHFFYQIFKKNKGFTLLEVLIAVCIIAIVFIVFLQLNVFNLMSLNRSSTLTKLTFLTKSRLSEIEISDYPETGTKSGDFENYPGYKWVENASEFGIDGVRKIELTVSSPDGNSNKVTFYKAK
ncbi:prepilin-type N-terminal cleavage/methylation domain-containing protein [Candidatus Desantisbacteria bacterium]|nr:prepilin-type N-terminal cleavage/methylation domain-containing protein [Candidatus Desantisbacteria bacterium]